MIYRTIEGDTLDAICARHYGTEHGTSELVLAFNHGLANKPPLLPVGTLINLPDVVESEPVIELVQVWE